LGTAWFRDSEAPNTQNMRHTANYRPTLSTDHGTFNRYSYM